MLRITTKERPGSVTMVLEGRLCGAWTAEAEKAWLKLASTAEGQELAVDLSGLTFVDKAGESWLASILGQGAKVKASGVLISHIVHEVERRL
jgi:anti-anti-sigma regulatory factor